MAKFVDLPLGVGSPSFEMRRTRWEKNTRDPKGKESKKFPQDASTGKGTNQKRQGKSIVSRPSMTFWKSVPRANGGSHEQQRGTKKGRQIRKECLAYNSVMNFVWA